MNTSKVPEGVCRNSIIKTSDRRAFLSTAFGATAALVGATAMTWPYVVPPSGERFQIRSEQNNWRFCDKCYGLFFWGYPTDGRCPAGDAHRAAGYNFVLLHDLPPTPGLQDKWRFCGKCYGLFFWGYNDDGRCPARAGHVAAGYNFCLSHKVG